MAHGARTAYPPQVDTATEGGGSVTVGSTSTAVVAANANRVKITIINDSDEAIYLAYGKAAVSNKGIRLNANGGNITEETWTGAINAICASGSKVATYVEL